MTPVCFVPVVSPDRLACHLRQRRIVLIEQESYRKIVDNSDLSFGTTRLGRGRDYHLLTERGLVSRIIYTILPLLVSFEPPQHGAVSRGIAIHSCLKRKSWLRGYNSLDVQPNKDVGARKDTDEDLPGCQMADLQTESPSAMTYSHDVLVSGHFRWNADRLSAPVLTSISKVGNRHSIW